MRLKFSIGILIGILLLASTVFARDVVPALDGLTGGTDGKLDSVPVSTESGVTALGSIALTRESSVSGVTLYVHELVATGGLENSPYLIVPDDAGAGNTRWSLMAIAGATLWGKVLVIDTRTVTATRIDEWNTAYSWDNHATKGYLTGVTDISALLKAGGAWAINLSEFASGVSEVFDKGTDTLDAISDGLAYKLIPALTKTQIDNFLAGNTPYTSGLTAAAQTQINTVRGIADAAPSLPTVKTAITNGTTPFVIMPDVKTEITAGTTPFTTMPLVKDEITSGGSIFVLNSVHNAQLGAGGLNLAGTTPTGILPIAKGGTGSNLSATSGAVVAGDGSVYKEVTGASARGAIGAMATDGSNNNAVSIWGGAQMTANQVAVGPQVSIVDAGAGVSVPFVVPYAFVMSGVSVEVNTAGTNGVSLYWISGVSSGQVQAIASQFFAYVGGSGANQYNWTHEQYIPAMSKFAVRLPDAVAAGTSVWNIFFPGRKP